MVAAKKKAKEEAKKAFKGKPPTKPLFKLTRPKPRHVPEPEEIQQGTPAVPVPHKLFARTSLKKIAEEDAERRARSRAETIAKYEGIKREPNLHETPDTVRDLRAKVEEDRMAPCRVRFRAKPAPRQTADAQVKMTAAAIMREDALYKKKQEKEKVTLEKFETELRDTSEFYRWQSEEWKKEEEAKLARGAPAAGHGGEPRPRRGDAATWRATSLRQQRCGRVARRCCGYARRRRSTRLQKQRLAECAKCATLGRQCRSGACVSATSASASRARRHCGARGAQEGGGQG